MTTTFAPMTLAHSAVAFLQQKKPDFKAKIGIILGSGLGKFAENLEHAVSVSYGELLGFPNTTIYGHEGQVIMGSICGINVVCLKGRTHAYEGLDLEVVKTYVRTLKLLGCEYLFITNAAGSLRVEVPPGELVMITDHINLQPHNPLIGPNDEAFGPRFLPLDNAYDKELQKHFANTSKKLNIPLNTGVYVGVTGPHYETAAEIRAFKLLGGDVIGMSTIPEVLVARHCGIRVAAISTITNLATGLTETAHSHEVVVSNANAMTEKLSNLITGVIADM
jgi:xanthosine phosphorylase